MQNTLLIISLCSIQNNLMGITKHQISYRLSLFIQFQIMHFQLDIYLQIFTCKEIHLN